MDAGGISSIEKLEWVHCLLDELSRVDALEGTWGDEVRQAQFYIEDIRELFWDDMK